MQNKLIISLAIVGSLFFLSGCSESDDQAEITEESSEYSTSAEEGDVMKSPDLPPNVTLAGNINGGRNSSLVLEANTPKGVLRIAQTYADANGDFVLKGIGDNAAGFAPTAPVPEPEALALMLSGTGILGFIGRRRLVKEGTNLLNQNTAGLSAA